MKIFIIELEEAYVRYLVWYKRVKIYAKRGQKHEGFRYNLKEVQYHYKRTAKRVDYYLKVGFKKDAYPNFHFDIDKNKVFRQQKEVF